jgi:hypothetical protein
MPSRSRDTWSAADWRHWKALREFILTRDEHACKSCGKGAKTVARIDFDGPEFEPANLRAECRECIGHRAYLRGNPTPRAYPTPENWEPDDPRWLVLRPLVWAISDQGLYLDARWARALLATVEAVENAQRREADRDIATDEMLDAVKPRSEHASRDRG